MANQIWKLNGRRGIVYVEGKGTAERVLGLCGEEIANLSDRAMAIYSDRRGRAFAWQIPFDLTQWDTVSAMVEEQEPSSPPLRK